MSWSALHRRLACGEATLAERLLGNLLLPLAGLYGVGLAVRQRAAAARWRHPEAWPVPVLGVGALTAGGSGKTPFAAFLAERLRRAGRRPLLVAHGYGAPRRQREARLLRAAGECEAREDWQSAGEESLLLAHLVPRVAVVVAPRRREAWGAIAREGIRVDVAILDGGFQDRSLHQDLRIALLDASWPPGAGRLLPAGELREPWSALRRADLIVMHRSELCPDRAAWQGWLDRAARGIPRIWTRNLSGRPYALGADPGTVVAAGRAIDWSGLADQRLGVWTAIGHPQAFVAGLRREGIVPVWSMLARDHAGFDMRDARELARAVRRERLSGILVTEKDAVKMARFVGRLPRVWVVPARVDIVTGESELDARLTAALAGR